MEVSVPPKWGNYKRVAHPISQTKMTWTWTLLQGISLKWTFWWLGGLMAGNTFNIKQVFFFIGESHRLFCLYQYKYYKNNVMIGNWGWLMSHTSWFVMVIKLLCDSWRAVFWFCCVRYIFYWTLSGSETGNSNAYILKSICCILLLPMRSAIFSTPTNA